MSKANNRLLLSILTVIFSTAVLTIAQDVEIGEAYMVGTTWWFNQQNTTVGKTIARDERGGVHFVWTYSSDIEISDRNIYYNFFHEQGGDIQEQLDEIQGTVDHVERAGYASLDLGLRDNSIIPYVFYHTFGQIAMSYDWSWGVGAFDAINFESPNRQIPLLAKGTIDRGGRAHVVSGTHSMGGDAVFPIILWHGEHGDQFDDWEVTGGTLVDRATGLSHHIKSSRETNRVALAWIHNRLGVPAPEGWENTIAYTMNNDLYLVISEDGEEWNVDEPFNATRTIPPDGNREGLLAYGDTLRPYNDLDMIWIEDVLHVVFSTRGYWADPALQNDPPVERITTTKSFIWHWDSETDSLTLVADGWFDNEGDPSSLHSNVSRPSLGVGEDGTLYCLFRQISEEDCNANDYCFGELMLAKSEDDGIRWSQPLLLTGTAAENDDETEYVDECHPCLAERVDDFLHIYYVLAPEAIETPQEGVIEECQMIYQRIPVDDLPDLEPLELPREGFQYHNRPPVSVADNPAQPPDSPLLVEAFPNPFNAELKINYRLTGTAGVNITIANLNGERIYRRRLERKSAGSHSLTINASQWASGIYIVGANSGVEKKSIKIIGLK